MRNSRLSRRLCHFRHVLPLLLVGAGVRAGDFRNADFGQPCDTIKAQELALGSREIPWPEIKGEDPITLKGVAYGREVEIVFLCKDGKLVAGNHFFAIESTPEKALEDFQEIYRELRSIYGAPFVGPDGLSPDSKPDVSKKGLVMGTMTSWRTPRVWITASVLPLAESVGGGYRVSVISWAPHESKRGP